MSERLSAVCGEVCRHSFLSLSVEKTKEIIVEFRSKAHRSPLHVNGFIKERSVSTKFLGVHIAEDLSWSLNTTQLFKKAQQRMHFFRRLKGVRVSSLILATSYCVPMKSILMSCILFWYSSCGVSERKTLQSVVRMAEKVIRSLSPPFRTFNNYRCRETGLSTVRDTFYSANELFGPLLSGRRYHSIKAKTARMCNSFFPQAIRLLNSWTLCYRTPHNYLLYHSIQIFFVK